MPFTLGDKFVTRGSRDESRDGLGGGGIRGAGDAFRDPGPGIKLAGRFVAGAALRGEGGGVGTL